jgi:predicted adenylyl cyclase CyaB
MSYLNVEIKARCNNPESIRQYLRYHEADFKGTDHQTDTYFNVKRGRLKLREGNIEKNLIYYDRSDLPGVKESHFQLVNVSDAQGLKEMLSKCLGIKIVVRKSREIYFIENVKFHIDEVAGLGSFAEIEASNMYQDKGKEELHEQCNFYLNQFRIRQEDLISNSYSDMLMPGSTGDALREY